MKISKTARASGATGKVKSKGPQRINQKYKKGHRAHKRDSIPIILPAGQLNRDARKRLRRIEQMHDLALKEWAARDQEATS